MLTAVVLSLYGCKSADREKAEADTVKTEESTVPESDTAENVGQDTDGNGADRASAKSSTSANDSPSEESLGKNGDPISGGSDEKGTLSDSDTNGNQQTDKAKNFAAGAADALGKVQEPLNVKEEDDMAPVFTSEEIPDEVFARMAGKSYKEDCTVPREDLRYLRISCVGADGSPYVGEMVAAADLAEDLLDIFRQLYEAGYPIERMQLIDDYDARRSGVHGSQQHHLLQFPPDRGKHQTVQPQSGPGSGHQSAVQSLCEKDGKRHHLRPAGGRSLCRPRQRFSVQDRP